MALGGSQASSRTRRPSMIALTELGAERLEVARRVETRKSRRRSRCAMAACAVPNEQHRC
jgi:hypothetical protein